jgi:hypothetical protein
MACPSSGTISMLGIFSEKNEDDYSAANLDGENTLSLRGFSSNSHNDSSGGNININSSSSNKPDGNTPHNMSEFHSYDHDATSLTSFSSASGTTNSKAFCSQSIDQTYYHDGSGTLPAVNDNVYSDSAGSSPLADGYYKNSELGGYRIEDEQVASLVNC